MQCLRSKRLVVTIAGGLAAFLLSTLVNAQLIFSQKEVERQHRTQWLLTKRSLPVYPDERMQRYARCVAGDLIRELGPEWQDLNWEVIVFDDEEPNASVLLGGKVTIYSGIFRVADTPDAFAAVLGHEMAHLTEGHVMERTRAASRTSAAAILGSAVTGLSRSYVEQGAMIGMQLPFQRRQESEADAKGLEYMAKAGFDPRAALELWKNMDELTKGRNQPPQWMSTHPRSQERIDDMVPLLVQNLKLYNEAREEGKRPNCFPK
jgi:predicted Zn-dependent protease